MCDDNLLKILFVEDLPSDVELAVLELRKEKLVFKHITVCTGEDLKEALKSFKPDLIISDYMMPAYNGMQALRDVKEFSNKIPFILFTGSINEETAVKCIKAGAADYVIKEHLTRLPFAVKEALEQQEMLKEKRASELLLRESEEKLQSIFSVAPVGIGLVIDRVLMEVNDTLCNLTGYKRSELIGQSSAIIYTNLEEFEFVGKEKYRQIAEKGTGSVETLFKCKNGKILNVILSSTPLDRNNLSKGVTFTVLNITESVNNQIELQKLSRAVEQNPASIVITDFEGIIEYANTKMCEVTGYSKNELIGKNPSVLSSGEKGREEYALLWHTIKSGKEWKGEFHNKRKNGELYWERATISPIINERNEITHFLGIKEDVTVQKILEASIFASEQRYRDLFMNNPFPTYIFDTDSLEFIEVNDATVLNYGYSREEFASMTLKDLRLSEDIPELIETVKHLGDLPSHSTNMRHRRKDGLVFPVENTSYILPEKNGRRTRLSMTLDITERVKAAEQMNLAKEKAEASDRLKTTFLNNISHEVRTPLNGILGFAEIMSQTDLPEKERIESISMLHESCDRLLTTITSYMDISLLTSGNLSLHKKDFLPERILRRIFNVYEKICLEKNLKLVLEIPENTNNLLISTDPEIFQKILIHILNNAIKFTFKGSINFGYVIQKGNVEFFVKDTGIGIGKDAISSIFDHFVKEDRGPSKLSEGSGLGLSIAKGMIGILGGTIRVESEIEVGTSFFFAIPITEVAEKLSSDKVVTETEKVKTGAAILIAEDDEANFFYLNAVLKRETDATILHASNGREAIELFKNNPGIVLILMDIKMPIMDGFEATKQIKLLNKDIPIIGVTAYAMLGDEKRVFDAGCDGYLSKPINRKILIDKVAQYLVIR
jgi:PAS domain S-box-containing protein